MLNLAIVGISSSVQSLPAFSTQLSGKCTILSPQKDDLDCSKGLLDTDSQCFRTHTLKSILFNYSHSAIK